MTTRLVAIVLAVGLLTGADKPMKPVKFGPLTPGPTPAGWVREKPDNRLRAAQFRLTPPTDAKESTAGELTVTGESTPRFSGKFLEWTNTFADGSEVKTDLVNLPRTTVAHLLDITGTWKYRERPRDPSSKEELRADSRVIWVVVVNAEETTHLRLSGPKAVVAAHHAAFLKWLKSAK